MNKYIKIGAVVLLAVAIVGAYEYPKYSVSLGSSASGSTFLNAKSAGQAIATNSSTSTLYAVLNTDTSDRIIDGAVVNLLTVANGQATSTTFQITCATSSVATGFTPSNTNYVYNQLIKAVPTEPFGTTTGNQLGYYLSTSSPGIMGTTTTAFSGGAGIFVNQYARDWPTGTYLVCELTTAVGSLSNLLASTTQGVITFPYHGQ